MRDLECHARHDARHDVAIADRGEAIVHGERSLGQDHRPVNEAVAILGSARGVVAVAKIRVVLVAEARSRRSIEVVHRVAARAALRRIGEAAPGRIALARRA